MNVFSYGITYVVLFLYLFVIAIFDSSKQLHRVSHIFAFISMVVLSLFIGLRWETGTDWLPYKLLFDDLELNWSFLLDVYHFDLGFVLFNGVVRLFSDNYTVFLVANASITIYLLCKLLCRWSPYPNISLFIFYPAFMIAQFMGSNRRMMAMVFLLWAIYYLWNNKKKAYYLLVGLAFLFHRSSIIALILLFVPREIISNRKVIILLSLSLIVGISQLPFKLIEEFGNALSSVVSHPLVTAMTYYSETNENHIISSTGSIVIQSILAICKRSIFLIFYFYILKKNEVDKLTGYIFNIYILGFVGYLFFIGTFFQILTAYFALIEVILISRMYGYTNSKTKFVFLSLTLLYGIVQMISALNVYPDLYMPYIPFWSNIQR